MSLRSLALILLVPFSLLTVYAVMEVGYIGVFDYQRHSPAGWQVFFDLVLSLLLILIWMIPNARENGRNPWPFVMVTLFLGVIGPLLYLLGTKDKDQQLSS
ncbi:hypothetical protein QGN29_09330 [Temperatibacter marinus]|uniref:DUF2834 domain-containing protein n=1 Tax=Temperatibacter marinus TaxID=1456591 RepID=A0AA52EG82_9PROT|nr:hypothetical protein [Temperatibacter marinus]WND01754.1 hypothetical protein QGN29_09330 [Temperatibacter marinus]